MKKSRSFFLFVSLHLLCFVTIAQTNQFKFDFGTGKNVPGYLAISLKTIFNIERVYSLKSKNRYCNSNKIYTPHA
jgi:hypothetical protein